MPVFAATLTGGEGTRVGHIDVNQMAVEEREEQRWGVGRQG